MVFRRLSGKVLAAPRATSSLSAAFLPRYCSTTPGNQESVVDVESWTLNEELVKKHQAARARWQAFGENIDTLKTEKRYEDLLAELKGAKELYAEVGADDSPVLCNVMLALEESQVHYNLKQSKAAIASCDEALKILEALPVEHQDLARVAEIKEMKGYAYLQDGDVETATAIFTELRDWIDKGCNGAPPMVTISAKNMRRTVITGLGLCYEAAAQKEADKVLFDKALNTLIDGLNNHIEENDVGAVKQTLDGALRCFIGMKDMKQAEETCEKYISWCRRHKDEEGIAHGEAELAKLKSPTA